MPEWTFAFVDLAGFTALTEAHGDQEAAAQVQRFVALSGDCLQEGEQLVKSIGDAVMLAARVAAQAHAGQILATAAVAEQAREAGIRVVGLGRARLHNVADEVEIFEVHCDAPDTNAVDPVCRMRVDPEAAAGRLRFDGHDYWFCSLACAAAFSAAPAQYVAGPGE